MKTSSRPINCLKIVQVGFFLNAIVWTILGVYTLWRTSGKPDSSMMMLVIAIMMFGNVGAFIFCGLTISRKSRIIYMIAILVLAINIVLSITDEFGLLDLAIMLIDLLILGFLIAGKKQITRAENAI
jgi:hypothetical protein